MFDILLLKCFSLVLKRLGQVEQYICRSGVDDDLFRETINKCVFIKIKIKYYIWFPYYNQYMGDEKGDKGDNLIFI